jgi:hypothetical protein
MGSPGTIAEAVPSRCRVGTLGGTVTAHFATVWFGGADRLASAGAGFDSWSLERAEAEPVSLVHPKAASPATTITPTMRVCHLTPDRRPSRPVGSRPDSRCGGIGMSEAVEVVKEILRGARLLSRRVAVM